MGYSLSIVSVQSVTSLYNMHYSELVKKYHLSFFHKEAVYDWFITNAIHRILELKVNGKVLNHVIDDTCRHIYSDYTINNESIGYIVERELDNQLACHAVSFFSCEIVKLLVIDNNILIARGTNATL